METMTGVKAAYRITEYISMKALYKVGIVSKRYFENQIFKAYKKYESCSLSKTTNLVQASLDEVNNNIEILQYDKGMVVVYLFEKELQARGTILEKFLEDFYKTYAVTHFSLDNTEIIRYIDNYLENTAFTEKYVLGTEFIFLADLDLENASLWWNLESCFPPVPFPYNVIVVVIIFIVLFLVVVILLETMKRKLQENIIK